MTLKEINNLRPGRLRALTGMTVNALGQLLAITVPELTRRRAHARPRPSNKDRQKRLSSGKKKRHTLKSQVVSDETGEVLDVAGGHRGPAAGKKIYEASEVGAQFPMAVKQADLGYLGTAGLW
jgi:hypothetical protein